MPDMPDMPDMPGNMVTTHEERMLRLGLVHAKPGMILGLSVVHPTCPEVTLLRAGAALEEMSIHRLREIGVHEVWIRYPSLDHLIQFVNPQMHEACRHLTADIGKTMNAYLADSHARLDFYSYKRAVMGVIENAMAHPKAAIFIHELAERAPPAMRQAGNVCVASILIGLKLDFYLVHQRSRLSSGLARDLSGLGVGAMLHDIGMLRLDPAVVARFEATGDESDAEWQEHTRLGFEMIKGDLDPTAAAAVLNHHQKFDGSGFPRRVPLKGLPLPVKGSDIHVFARIITCADLFDRIRFGSVLPKLATTDHAQRPPPTSSHTQLQTDTTSTHSIKTAEQSRAMPAVRALKLILSKPYSDWIDPVIVRALMSVVPAFAPGTIVHLSNGRRAAVVDWRPSNPCSPIVQPIGEVDRGGWDQREQPRIDLERTKDLRVARVETAEGSEDVSADLFWPEFDGDFDLARIGRILENRALDAIAATTKPKPASQPATNLVAKSATFKKAIIVNGDAQPTPLQPSLLPATKRISA